MSKVISSIGIVSAAVFLWGCGREAITTHDATLGTLRAARLGRTVLVEVGLQDVPDTLDVLTMGLKLADGAPVYPRTVRWLPRPTEELAGCPRVEFTFGGPAAMRPAHAAPEAWLVVTFDLDDGQASADGGAFTLVLGDPEAMEGCRLGITTTVSPRDGSPSLFACIYLPRPGPGEPLQLPPPPTLYVPTVAFRFEEQPRRVTGGARVDILPKVTRSGLMAVQRDLAMRAARR